MSSRAVRQAVRGWMAGLASPYYDTINMDQAPTDNRWVTADFESFGTTKESFCDNFVEDGEIALTFFGPPGIGDDTLLAQAEADAVLFYGKSDPSNKVLLLNKSAPEDFVITESGPRFGVTFRFSYEFRV